MSVKWMAAMWESDLEGPELLLAIAIADHADADGRCFPGLDSLSRKIKRKRRQVQDLITRLEAKGILKVERGSGRGHMTVFQFQKVQNTAPFSMPEKMQESAPFDDEKRCSSPQIKGAGFRTEKVQFSASALKEEPFKEPGIEPRGKRAASGTRETEHDERASHPAIKAYREAASRFPNKVLWPAVIETLGDTPDLERLKETYVAWIGCGNNPMSVRGILDWYRSGKRDNRIDANGNGFKVPPRDADCDKCGNERRIRGNLETWPCEYCRPVEYQKWAKGR